MNTVGIPNNNAFFPLLMATDWLTERPETVLNVMGDTIALALAQKYALGLDIDPKLNQDLNLEKGEVNEKKNLEKEK
jgi:Na+/H+-dicarboxylate symporter